MNFDDRICAVIDAMAVAVGTEETPFPIIRANQGEQRPPYPYGIFSTPTGNGEDAYQHSITDEDKEGDPNVVIEKQSETIKYNVSLSFLGKGDSKPLYALAEKARKWLMTYAGEDVCTAQSLVARLNGPITDRSVLIDPDFEQRVGFDFRLDGEQVTEQEIGIIETAGINGETVQIEPPPEEE